MGGRLLQLGKWGSIALVAIVVLFLLGAWIGSSIARNSDWQEPAVTDAEAITILIGSNGIHTEIAMPIVTREMDWSSIFPASDIAAPTRDYTHVAVSWGERQFFLETPSWTDVNPVIVVNAMTGGEAVLHVAHYVRPAPAQDYRELRLRPEEYRALVSAIESQLVASETREVLPGYGSYDVFYTARGTYHVGNTCNQWTSDMLAAAGVKVGRWSPLPGGVMKWVPDLPEN